MNIKIWIFILNKINYLIINKHKTTVNEFYQQQNLCIKCFNINNKLFFFIIYNLGKSNILKNWKNGVEKTKNKNCLIFFFLFFKFLYSIIIFIQ